MQCSVFLMLILTWADILDVNLRPQIGHKFEKHPLHYFILLYGGVDPSAILLELPIYFSLFVYKKSSMICITYHSFLLKLHKHQAACEKIKVWIGFCPWIFFYVINFFINLQISTEWEFTFLNIAIKKFCLIYSLNIPYSKQNPSFFRFERSSLQNSHFSDVSPYRL